MVKKAPTIAQRKTVAKGMNKRAAEKRKATTQKTPKLPAGKVVVQKAPTSKNTIQKKGNKFTNIGTKKK